MNQSSHCPHKGNAHPHYMILVKCNTARAKGKYHVALSSFFNTLVRLMHEHNKFIVMQYLQSY